MENKLDRSQDFYIRITGKHALFSTPYSKGGGEAISYPVPTKQALLGIVDACYWKPVLKNVVEEVKVIKPIRTQVRGSRALLKDGTADLNYLSYLFDVEYLLKYHFEWNTNREDLIGDRNMKKHTEIVKRSLEKGGRRDIFLGRRECRGDVEGISKKEYEEKPSFYKNSNLSLGIMFNSFIYPEKSGDPLVSAFSEVEMRAGVIEFLEAKDCAIKNILSNYTFRCPERQKGADEELRSF